MCWDQGARGLCSEACTAGSCPASAACASFVDGAVGPRCLARCAAEGDCSDDPWLACRPPGGAGALDFSVDEAAAPLGYCAPKPCLGPEDCGADGACVGGYCGPA
jgi:hypothetical protein